MKIPYTNKRFCNSKEVCDALLSFLNLVYLDVYFLLQWEKILTEWD